MYKVTTCMVCFPLKYFYVVYMLLLIRCSQSANLGYNNSIKGKFLSSVYSFITSPGTLPQEIVICFRLEVYWDQPSLGDLSYSVLLSQVETHFSLI